MFRCRYTWFIVILGGALIIGCGVNEKNETLKAGFARVNITPPVGTPMTGFGSRDFDPAGCRDVHDDLYVRALWLEQGERKALVMGFDLLFFSRDEADRFKGAVGRRLDIAPGDILLNTSHTHTGPKVGTWFYTPPDPFYLNFLEQAIVKAALSARDNARPASLASGNGRSDVPMSRRRKRPDGFVDFAPNPQGPVCDALPVCLLSDAENNPICLLFSISCHPSTVKGVERSYWISADFPGTAMGMIDDYLGAQVSLFLQGAGGDSKASVIGRDSEEWRAGTWDDVDAAGAMAADEVIGIIEGGLDTVKPDLRSCCIEMQWRLEEPRNRAGYAEIAANPQAHSESMPEVMRMWAREQIALLDRGYELPSSVTVTAHGISLGENVRMIGIEGELVAELGNLIIDHYIGGVTFPLGYTDGAQMYLPTTAMLGEGGYEVESYWEYRQPSPLAGGHEKILSEALAKMGEMGVR